MQLLKVIVPAVKGEGEVRSSPAGLAAGNIAVVNNCYLPAGLGQQICSSHARDPGAYNGHVNSDVAIQP